MSATVSPKPATILMWLTYLAGGIGSAIGFYTLGQDPPSLTIAALLAVTVTGILSFVRHAIYNRSDAVRGGWDYGQRNNFQIEVGLANLAWGLYALIAVIFDLGLMALAASFLISGLYFLCVTIFILVTRDLKNRGVGPLIGIGMWALITLAVGIWGTAVAA